MKVSSNDEMGAVDTPTHSRWSGPMADYHLIVAVTAVLVIVGLISVLSASSVYAFAKSGSSFSLVAKQALAAGMGTVAFWVASRVSVRVLRMMAYPALAVAVLGLGAVLVMGHGAYGATRWIDIGPVMLQPSEFAKFALLVWGADLMTRKHRLVNDTFHVLVPLLPVAGVLAGMVMLQPDLGTTMCLGMVLVGLLVTIGTRGRILASLFGAGVLGVFALAYFEPYRWARMTTFVDPWADPSGAGYQVIQGLYAVTSGGWFGVGLGESHQKWSYLPNAHTDYVYAIIAEETGVVGAIAVLLLFAVLAFVGVRIARRTRSRFSQLASVAVVTLFLGEAVINIGAVLGVVPVTGIPLPLVSYGGSAMVLMMLLLGMLAGFARNEPAAQEQRALAEERRRAAIAANEVPLTPLEWARAQVIKQEKASTARRRERYRKQREAAREAARKEEEKEQARLLREQERADRARARRGQRRTRVEQSRSTAVRGPLPRQKARGPRQGASTRERSDSGARRGR